MVMVTAIRSAQDMAKSLGVSLVQGQKASVLAAMSCKLPSLNRRLAMKRKTNGKQERQAGGVGGQGCKKTADASELEKANKITLYLIEKDSEEMPQSFMERLLN